MAKIDTLFMTKMVEKPYPLGAAHTYIGHIREYLQGFFMWTLPTPLKIVVKLKCFLLIPPYPQNSNDQGFQKCLQPRN